LLTLDPAHQAEMAASRKETYIEIETHRIFQPIVMETLGVFSSSARQFLSSLGLPPAETRLERHVFSSRESWCCCSTSTLSYSKTACRR